VSSEDAECIAANNQHAYMNSTRAYVHAAPDVEVRVRNGCARGAPLLAVAAARNGPPNGTHNGSVTSLTAFQGAQGASNAPARGDPVVIVTVASTTRDPTATQAVTNLKGQCKRSQGTTEDRNPPSTTHISFPHPPNSCIPGLLPYGPCGAICACSSRLCTLPQHQQTLAKHIACGK
jgi:hypothetical protein